MSIDKRENGEKPQRLEEKTFCQNVANYFGEFAENTGIHGFKYIGDQKRLIVERCWWLFFFSVSLYICITLIVRTWIKWEVYPVFVSFARSPTAVWEIPFPAVTICPEIKIKQRTYNFSHYYHLAYNKKKSMSDKEMKNFTAAVLICKNTLYSKGEKIVGTEGITHLTKIAPQFDELFLECEWMGNGIPCRDLFKPMLTADGFCFTSNMLHRHQIYTKHMHVPTDFLGHFKYSEGWSLEDGYPDKTRTDTYPKRAMASGASASLFLTLRAYKQDMDFICRGPAQGFKVLLHHPSQIPRISSQYFRAPLNQEVAVSIKPDIMTTSDGLKGYDPHRRQCLYAKERKLYFYKTYTQQNCQIECEANFTLRQCNCVAFYMPHEKLTPICGSGSNKCVQKSKQDLLIRQVTSELKSDLTDCDCLPACTSITYNAETSQAAYRWPQTFVSLGQNSNNDKGMQLTRIGLFFKEMQFITSERNELYGQTDFMANCGAFLGLFTGFSFLSIVEILYYLTLRLVCNIHMYGKSRWFGNKT